MSVPQTNLLLDALSPEARDRILSQCKAVSLPVKTALMDPDEPVRYAYFLTSGFASVVVDFPGGGSAEVALIAREGVVGGLQVMGPALAPSRCFVQLSGTGYRMRFADLRTIFKESEEVRSLILENVQVQSLVMSQLAACNRLHQAEARLSRWLLMAQDRVQEDTLILTQEFLGQMLGTQRTTVVMVVGAMQRSGLITLSRGKITINSRQNLEDAACDCYKIVRDLIAKQYRRNGSAA